MSRASKRLAAGVIAVVVLAAWGPAGAESATGPGGRLIARMREAVGEQDFSGIVAVTWRAASGEHERANVEVRAVDGALEIVSDGQVVLDEGDQTFFRDQLGWSSAIAEPAPSRRPSPDQEWTLSVRKGIRRLGRPTTLVVASRDDGAAALRLWIDDETRLPIGREVLEPDGTVQRSFFFTTIEVGDASTSVADAPDTAARAAQPLPDAPSGYQAPDTAGAGYALVSRSQHTNGVQLVYSDGLFSVSVLEQRGELDWDAMPRGGTDTSVDGARARRYAEPMGDVIVWERDGVVFTGVSDAPSDVFAAMLTGLAPDPGIPERVVDFVLGPFGFD